MSCLNKALFPLWMAATLTAAENFFPNPGFETWDHSKNLPDSTEWHWNLPKGENAFSVFEQSSSEKHSGKFSLHLKDEATGKSSQSIMFPLTKAQLQGTGGKVLRFSAWCKQVFASRPKSVGIGIMLRSGDGKTHWRNARIDASGSTGWQFLETKIMIPQDTVFVRLTFDCAAGWGNTAEAYFDDIRAVMETPGENIPRKPQPSPESPKVKIPEKKEESVVSEKNGIRLSLLSDLGASWRIQCWGGFRLLPRKSDMPLSLEIPKGILPYAGFSISSNALNRGFDLTDQPISNQTFQLVMNRNLPIQVKFFSSRVSLKQGISQQDGLFLYEIPLSSEQECWDRFCGVSIQFPEKTPPQKVIVSRIGIASTGVSAKPSVNRMPRELRNFLEIYQKKSVWNNDHFERPDIQKGTFYERGEPVFYVGPWIYNRIKTDWGPHSNPLQIKHIAYTTPPSKKLFDAMGFNSTQISAAWTLPGHAAFGLPVPMDLAEKAKEISQFFRGFEGVPLVLDFAFSDADSLKKDDPQKYQELNQRNPYWHEFIPFCPEHPEGAKFYDDYFQGGVKSALLNQGNVFVYELFNESSYFCACRWNIAEFAKRMKKKYGTIKDANLRWNTIFDSFEDLATQTDLHQFQGLWADWCKFSADRYVEVLKHQKAVIRKIDRRKNVYFTEQLSGGNLYTEVGAGMDYRKIAEAMDLVTYEGGVGYGKKEEINRQGMEAVVFSPCSEIWFNSAFFSAISKNKKPILNNEHYCKRSEHGIRVPSRREDMITSLWGELFRGVSGNFSYSWDKRSWEWKTFEQARENVLFPSYKGAGFLNPYNWPVEQLDAFALFRKELEPFRKQVLPMPRTRPATVALFFSYPTLRMLSYHRFDFRKRMVSWFSTLVENHYPVQIVFEEDLISGLPGNIQALVIPCAVYATPETIPAIEQFIRRRGVVIAGKDSLIMDEYGRKLDGLKGKCIRLDADSSVSLQKIPLVLHRNHVLRHASLEGIDGRALTGSRIDMIDRGSFKMIFMVAMNDLEPRLARIRIDLDENDRGKYYLTDVITRRLYSRKGEKLWSAENLKQGFALPLPPQERVLLTLSEKEPENCSIVDISETPRIFQKMVRQALPRITAYKEKERQRMQKEYERRHVKGVLPEKCIPLDLRGAANMGFKDEVSGDQKGGWFDQGSNDFSSMPLGNHVLANVPFHIIDPKANNGKAALILRGWGRSYFPEKISAIPVGMKANRIYFLHTFGWDPPKDALVLTYRVVYQDGTVRDIPCRAGNEIGGWWGVPVLKSAKIALECKNVLSSQINLQCFAWKNPDPEKAIQSIDIISAVSDAVPAVVAITVERPE